MVSRADCLVTLAGLPPMLTVDNVTIFSLGLNFDKCTDMPSSLGVCKQWTGLLDWITGLTDFLPKDTGGLSTAPE